MLRKYRMHPHQRLYLDLDGVMAGYDQHYHALYGHQPGDVTPAMMWENVFRAERFFFNLPLLDGAGEFFRDVAHLDPVFLTKLPVENFDDVAHDKRTWVRRYLSSDSLVIPLTLQDTKARYMNRQRDILVDDFESNTKPWDLAGGKSVLHTGNFHNTIHYMRFHMEDDYGRV